MTVTDGVRAFVDGASLIRSGRLGKFVWLPALVAAAIVALGVWAAFIYADQFGSWLAASLPGWLDFLSVVLVPLLYVLALLVGTWLFGFVAIILSSPFHGNLSAALEPHLATAPDTLAETRPLHQEVLAAIGREARKLRYQLPRLIGLLILTFIPVINVVSPILWFLFGAWMLAVQFADVPAENRQLPFRDTLELLRQNRGAALGYGICVTPLLAIPVVNFIVVPLAVAGGTVLWHRLRRISNV